MRVAWARGREASQQEGREEVAFRWKVTVDRRDRHACIPRYCRNGHIGEATGHHPKGGVQDAPARLLGLLRSERAAIRVR